MASILSSLWRRRPIAETVRLASSYRSVVLSATSNSSTLGLRHYQKQSLKRFFSSTPKVGSTSSSVNVREFNCLLTLSTLPNPPGLPTRSSLLSLRTNPESLISISISTSVAISSSRCSTLLSTPTSSWVHQTVFLWNLFSPTKCHSDTPKDGKDSRRGNEKNWS